MSNRILSGIVFLVLSVSGVQESVAQKTFAFSSNDLTLGWAKRTGEKWSLSSLKLKGKTIALNGNEGSFTIIYSEQRPYEQAIPSYQTLFGKTFVEGVDRIPRMEFNRVLNPVSFNEAGIATKLFPSKVITKRDSLFITAYNEYASVQSKWFVNPYGGGSELVIATTMTANKDGYFSMSTPSIMEINESMLQWATLPGYFQGGAVAKNLALAYGYGQGIPGKPVVLRDRNATTLTSIVTASNGLTVAASAAPGFGREVWTKDRNTHLEWKLGLGVMNRWGAFTPTLYYPVLGQKNSWLKKGEAITFQYYVSISDKDWFTMLRHVINDINHFSSSLVMRKNIRQSLSDRLMAMTDYVKEDSTSLWNQESFQGIEIGAQSYLGAVTGSDKDAMKNSDYGAMWMIASILHDKDSLLSRTRLPYARNFKLVQQEREPGFFQGAAIGQYYLRKSQRFVEEWGNYVEPIALTYYTMLDIGNLLLFNPTDSVLKERLKIGAGKLLEWQKKDGSWEVAYDRTTLLPSFEDLKDYRPTFYGMIVAYKILKDKKYLDAARKGADWYLEEGVKKGFFLGVCGDSRFVPDFATAQTAQSFLDLFEITGEEKYKQAAILAARFYISSIYTHPVSKDKILVNGNELQQWQIAQNGLGFEHGGNFGSATRSGPILLTDHAGLFVRIFELTKDSLFLNMARAGAIGREAFVDSVTSVASYYWSSLNRGAGPFPHHAWWQIGWIMDYLLQEAHLRSGGEIIIPSGFITPKVGPHKSYGFQPGRLYGDEVRLRLYPGLVHIDNANVEYLTFASGEKIYLVLMNDLNENLRSMLSLDVAKAGSNFKTIRALNSKSAISLKQNKTLQVALMPYGLTVFVLE